MRVKVVGKHKVVEKNDTCCDSEGGCEKVKVVEKKDTCCESEGGCEKDKDEKDKVVEKNDKQ